MKKKPNYCQCVSDWFDKVMVTSSGEFGYFVLFAKTDPANEACLDQVAGAHAGDSWAPISNHPGCYVLRCHYTVCPQVLAEIPNILGEPGFIGIAALKRPRQRRS